MNQVLREVAKEAADEIKRKLTDGVITTLYGAPIDITDQDRLIIAAYELGKFEERERIVKGMEVESRVLQ